MDIDIKRKKLGKMPSKPGSLLDRMFILKTQKSILEAELNKVKADITAIEEATFKSFKANGDLESARGALCQATISPRTVPVAKDWSKIFAYIKKQDKFTGFDLVQRRLGATAVQARWDEGVKIPGVDKSTFNVLHVKKLK